MDLINLCSSILKLLLLVVVVSACTTLTPKVNPGEVLFQDDFSRPSSGWDRYEDETYKSDYEDEMYIINIQQQNTEAWALPGLSFEDVIINVESSKVAGPDDNVYGVICRYQDSENFTFFLISSDGYTGIGAYIDGEKELLSHPTLLPSDAVETDGGSNYLRAECVREQLRLMVNNQLVAQAVAQNVIMGDVGLIAGSYDKSGVKVRFDNFSTIQP
jgi:hypothetical protein